MEGSSIIRISIRGIERQGGFARAEALADFVAIGWRAVSGWIGSVLENQRRAQLRRELHNLSDHFLKDIGLDRAQVDRLFR